MTNVDLLTDAHLTHARTAPNGRSAEVVLHDGPLRQTILALRAGVELGEHNSPPAASIQVLRGRVRVTALGEGDVEPGRGRAPGPHARAPRGGRARGLGVPPHHGDERPERLSGGLSAARPTPRARARRRPPRPRRASRGVNRRRGAATPHRPTSRRPRPRHRPPRQRRRPRDPCGAGPGGSLRRHRSRAGAPARAGRAGSVSAAACRRPSRPRPRRRRRPARAGRVRRTRRETRPRPTPEHRRRGAEAAARPRGDAERERPGEERRRAGRGCCTVRRHGFLLRHVGRAVGGGLVERNRSGRGPPGLRERSR